MFIKMFENRRSIMGWKQGAMGITKLPNQHGIAIDIVKNYGQIDKPTLKAHCEEFCKVTGANQKCAAQNNHLMVQCLKKSLTMASLARLKPYQVQYMLEGIKYAHHEAGNNLFCRHHQDLARQPQNLPAYNASVNGNVDLINSYFDTNYT
jgi:hypothetical protein